MPAAAWAGIAVLGNGDVVPLPDGRDSPGLARAAALGSLLLLALLLTGFGVWRRARRRRAVL